MRFLLGAALAVLFSCAARADPWDLPAASGHPIKESVALKVVGTSLMLADCRSTYMMMRKPVIYSEKNPLLGKHPSPRKVLWACVGTIATAHVVDHFLGPHASNVAWTVITAIEIHAVTNNYFAIQRGRELERQLEQQGRSPYLGLNLYEDPDSHARFGVSVPLDQRGVMIRFSVRF